MYQVELVEIFELDPNASWMEDPPPYSNYDRRQQTCGTDFDLGLGDTISMIAVGTQQDLSGHVRACDACLYLDATVSIDGVARISDARRGFGIGDARFADMFDAATDYGCRGSYWIGVVPVEDRFFATSSRRIATDYMLFREFYQDGTGGCRNMPPGCWDSWVVRIRDSSGRLITRELGEADGSAGLADD